METLGHSQVSLTLDTYSHVLPSLQAEAATRMNDAIGEIGCQIGCQDTKQPNSESQKTAKCFSESGEPPRNRTENPQIKSLLLCQLS